ncbi:hypothetical protein T4B_8830, partial [Trichinella pseudospiralis]
MKKKRIWKMNNVEMIKSELRKYKHLPYIVCTISEILKEKDAVGAENVANTDKLDSADEQNYGDELIVVKALSRFTIIVPNAGFMKPGVLKVGDLVAISRKKLKL